MDSLREIFDERLYGAAERLVENGSVLDVRILQGGSVITGVVEAEQPANQPAIKHRVYIRRSNGANHSSAAKQAATATA